MAEPEGLGKRIVTSFNRALPEKARESLLQQACARNLPVEVSLCGRREPSTLRSRMLKVGGLDGAGGIIIEVPTESGSSVLVHTNEVLDVLLVIGGQRFGFRSQVKKRGKMRLGRSVEVTVLSLDYPERVVRLQRRRFFRAKLPGLDPLKVECIVKREEGEGGDDNYIRFDGEAIDISSGGLGLRLRKARAKLVRQGRRMALTLKLEGFTEPIRLLAEVRHVRELEGTSDFVAGMQFVDWHNTLTGRRAINHITRYVVRKQREQLRKKSGIE